MTEDITAVKNILGGLDGHEFAGLNVHRQTHFTLRLPMFYVTSLQTSTIIVHVFKCCNNGRDSTPIDTYFVGQNIKKNDLLHDAI